MHTSYIYHTDNDRYTYTYMSYNIITMIITITYYYHYTHTPISNGIPAETGIFFASRPDPSMASVVQGCGLPCQVSESFLLSVVDEGGGLSVYRQICETWKKLIEIAETSHRSIENCGFDALFFGGKGM